MSDVAPPVATTMLGQVCLVELTRPPLNALDLDLLTALAAAYEAAGADNARAVVLAAAGKHFCAGARLSEDKRALTDSDRDKFVAATLRVFGAALPVVAAVQGAAVGGGLGLALSADFRIATPSSVFAANFTQLGLHAAFGITLTLPRLVGEQAAAELLMTGRRVKGEQAHVLGLCDHLVAADELRDRAIALARELATAAPLAVRATRATLRAELLARLPERMRHESDEQLRLAATLDHAEGVRAMSERRTPSFLGR